MRTELHKILELLNVLTKHELMLLETMIQGEQGFRELIEKKPNKLTRAK